MIPRKIHFNSGWEEIGGKNYYYKSGFEKAIACYAEFLKEISEIKDWLYEPEVFKFTEIQQGTRTYKPDYKIIFPDDSHIWWEAKRNFMKQKSITQLKRMSIYYPKETIVLFVNKIPEKYNKFKAKILKAEPYVERIIAANELDYFKGIKDIR